VELVENVEALLQETGLDPSLLDLEITESMMVEDEEAAIRMLQRLRDMGISLSLDDFGTGYSSLSYLRRLPIQTLQIDQTFVRRINTDAQDAALAGSIVAMAKMLGLRVVVEGVETEEQCELLQSLGCDEAQGFLFSKPITATEMTELLRLERERQDELAARGKRRTSTGKRRATASKSTASKSTATKSTATKATAPKATAPKATAPKATAPKATAPEVGVSKPESARPDPGKPGPAPPAASSSKKPAGRRSGSGRSGTNRSGRGRTSGRVAASIRPRRPT
jgi:hypothetical protein